ncbi:hypothetical protein ZWY2020_055663 [Hordeum vulgare]|nr:hypothetical protein ZWY2020_055663 [Hordeum vulgare]
MCIEAQHRLVFERVHGHGKFTFQAKHPSELKKKCFKKRVWFSNTGTGFVKVLNVIMATQGIPTMKVPNDIRLPLSSYTVLALPANQLFKGKLQPLHLAWLIYKDGPLLGGVIVDDDYRLSDEDSSYIYRGIYHKIKSGEIKIDEESGEFKPVNEEKVVGGHAVVCFAYMFEDGGEMILHVMDNHREDGPERWIAFSAFDEFVQLHAKPVDPKLLRRKKRFRKTDLLDPFDYMANKLYYFR